MLLLPWQADKPSNPAGVGIQSPPCFEVKKETPTEMSNPVYVSNVRIERRSGPLRIAHLPGEQQPVLFSVHGAIAEHYGLDPAKLPESHAATLDYVVAALGG
jgi:hypothetical protein